ncbi:MAG: arsenate reductase (glutaredoxin) [Deltaproteobacteria bacterium]|nr:arsenate reductase (glutaredoxin) [Deltaproteobacteria bacterium]
MTITLWHHPTCSKSRAAADLLRSLGVGVALRDYLASPPTRDELQVMLAALGLPPSQLARRREPLFHELDLASATEDEILEALVAHPSLLERPIAVREDHGQLRATLGRPAARVLELVAPSMAHAPHVVEAIARRPPT